MTFICVGLNAADDSPYQNRTYNEKIQTVQLVREEWNLSYPVIKLNSDEKLVLNFDLLGENAETFNYTFIHCDKDWQKSDIFVNDYIEGYPDNPIEDYKHSFNTTASYYHYSLSFPNDRITLKYSGNYAIVVYTDDPEKPSLIHRFIVSEDAAKIDADPHRPASGGIENTHQQIDFNVDYTGINVIDPYRNLYSFILQNGRWDMVRGNLRPDVYGNNQMKYTSLSSGNIFPGGNEYRNFDIKSIKHPGEGVRSIDYAAPYYNFYLHPSDDRELKPYFYNPDFNGRFYITSPEAKNADLDADYVMVYFTLPAKTELAGKVYVSGALTNWQPGKSNLMTYNNARGEYECTMLLKQGWYNFEYVFIADKPGDANPEAFEGSHYETENDYLILVYYRNPRERYDRVIGTSVINTLNRLSR